MLTELGDEGIQILVISPDPNEKSQELAQRLRARYVAVTGPMQAESGVIHVVTERIDDLTPLLGCLAEEGPAIEGLARCDEVKRPGREEREKQGPRRTPLVGLLTEMPELFADLDVPAHGSHHTVPKARRAAGS